MTSFAIDFVLKNLCSLSKWMLQKGLDAIAEKAADRAFDEVRKKSVVLLEKGDLEILQQAVRVLRSDHEKLASMITKQAKAVLLASYSHLERGLIILFPQNIAGKQKIDVLDFSLESTGNSLESARQEFSFAYSKATDAYHNQNLSLNDRICALKIILFSMKMLYENDWENLWENEILKFFQISKVTKIIKRRSGQDYEIIAEFAEILKFVFNDSKSCPKADAEIHRMAIVTHKFLRTQKLNSKMIRPLSIIDEKTKKTLLHFAIENGEVEILKELLLHKEFDLNLRADVDGRIGNGTLIHFAVFYAKVECLKLLIEAGVDLNSKDKDGSTALHLNAENGNLDCTKALIKAGADRKLKNNDGKTALDVAKDYRNKDFVNHLKRKQRFLNLFRK